MSVVSSPANLAVVRFGEGWRIWLTHGWVGLFDTKADALQCALDVALQVKREGRPTSLFVQGAFGEFTAMDASSTRAKPGAMLDADAGMPYPISALDFPTGGLESVRV